ncbi:hypothetical protein ACOMHN_017048 [Nucella lapillus]
MITANVHVCIVNAEAAVAAVARAISAYVDDLTGRSMQSQFLIYMPLSVPGLAPYPDFFALALVVLAIVIVALGVKESARLTQVLSIINIIVIIFIIICGFYKGDIHNWQLSGDEDVLRLCQREVLYRERIKQDQEQSLEMGDGIVMLTPGEETEDSRWAVPVSMGVTLVTDMVLYSCVAAVVTLMVPYFTLDIQSPVPFAFDHVGWPWAKNVIFIGALAGMTSSMVGGVFPMARVVYSMASDGLIFRSLSAVSPRFRTLVLGTVLSGLAAGVMALLFDLNELIGMMSIGTLLAFGLVAICVLILRRQRSHCEDIHSLYV